ncbi:tetraspanin-10 [Phodopus roborovskii]|uniref:tetraspanin-10 n=1 Tax=Phodopus roborovskii TaxID=109678 RepID=UPI0021E46CD5|nr:tetraspanin-10 [Phodopus roborovskii]
MAAAPISGLGPRAAAVCLPKGLAVAASASVPAPASRRRRHLRSSFAARLRQPPTSSASLNALRRANTEEKQGSGPANGRAHAQEELRAPRPRPSASHLGRASEALQLTQKMAKTRQKSPGKRTRPLRGVLAHQCIPFLLQGTAGQEPPLTRTCPPISNIPGPALWKGQGRAWGCRCCPGAKHQAWREGQVSSLPLSTGGSCVKYLTFLSNFFFSLLALLALATGLWGLAVKRSPESGWGGALPTDPMLALALGGLVVSVVSLSGCLGALCENRCLLHFYSGAVLICLALETLAGTLVVALWGPLQDGLKYSLHVAVIHYGDDPDLRFLLDQVQLGLQCCGAVSYQDWQQNLYFNCSSPGVQACGLPASCCINPQEEGALVNTQCGSGVLHLDPDAAGQVVYLQGCWPVLRQWLRGNMQTIGGCAITVVVIQGTELLLAACLLRALAVQKAAGGHRTRPSVKWQQS